MASFDWVTEDLAVGGRIGVDEASILTSALGVHAVADLRAEAADDAGAFARAGVAFLHLPTADHAPIAPDHLAMGLAFAADVRRRASGCSSTASTASGGPRRWRSRFWSTVACPRWTRWSG